MGDFANAYALLIGTGVNASGRPDPVYNSTTNDANWLSEILTDRKRCAYKPEQVTKLLGPETTREGILGAMERISSEANEDSTVIIFFSGHGGRDKNNKTFLIPYGYQDGQDPATLAIDAKCLKGCLAKFEVKQLVLLINCCHAAGVTETTFTPTLSSQKEQESDSLVLNESQIKYLSNGAGFVIMSSSLANEVSYTGYLKNEGSKNRYSAFTIGIGNALSGRGRQGNGLVYVTDLTSKCRAFVEEKTNNKQHPCFKLCCDDFPIAYYHGDLSTGVAVLGVGDDFAEAEPAEAEAEPPTPKRVRQQPNMTTTNYIGKMNVGGNAYTGDMNNHVTGNLHFGAVNNGPVNNGTVNSGTVINGKVTGGTINGGTNNSRWG
ncbi:hypothetical protein BC938DRAFT_480811 [Jimgerdemannia flammicorona]|uniref:Peptidase C14 caspase domain-containing protein n=1 Tax=Jimgerdemannia flammicorona TaxID=994334 RepID=A0A433QHN0_9FUNG|nr:hypothetical protein BC938DRAFT_480811 [Jimgerdemannia flammicorona]